MFCASCHCRKDRDRFYRSSSSWLHAVAKAETRLERTIAGRTNANFGSGWKFTVESTTAKERHRLLTGLVMLPVKVSEVVDALDCAAEEQSYYLDKRTGEIILVS